MDFHGEQITEEIEVQVHISNMALINSTPNMIVEDEPPKTGPAIDLLKETIFHLVIFGNWREVVSKCIEWPFIMEMKITSSEETIFHLVVAENQPKFLEELLDNVNDGRIIETPDEMGNTPLHLAAYMGKTDMVKSLINKRKELIKICNNYRETPLFAAASLGRNDTFLYLLSKCPPDEGIEYWRARDGNSILHVAIYGEHFDLAFQILKKCTIGWMGGRDKLGLADFVNERGHSPLHLLARKSFAFKSGNTLSTFSIFSIPDRILYRWIKVKPIEESFYDEERVDKSPSRPDKLPPKYMSIVRKLKSTTRNVQGVLRSFGKIEKQNGSHERWFPRNYETLYHALKLVLVLLLHALGFVPIAQRLQTLREKKQQHTWVLQVMEELIEKTSMWEYEVSAGFNPQDRELGNLFDEDRPPVEDNKESEDGKKNHLKEPYEAKDRKASGGRKESPILVAATHGVEEMVGKILEVHPVAIRDVNQDGKNVVLLAAENRQPHVYRLLCQRLIASLNTPEGSAYQIVSAFQKVDDDGNSVRHLVATPSPYKPGQISVAFLQMLWEIKWYKFVQKSMPRNFFRHRNNKGQTAKEVFIETHRELAKESRKWLNNTSNSCSVIAALIATAAFATVTTIPDEFEGQATLKVFAIASLAALFFSIASLIVFLAIIIYDYERAGRLTTKLIFGLNSLMISIAAMLISFFASLSLVLKDRLRNIAAFHVYAIASCLLMTLFVTVFLPLYEYVMISYIFKVPLRTYQRHVSLISSMK